MSQKVQRIAELPGSSLVASAHFFAEHLDAARALLGGQRASALAILLPRAGTDHDDWRRSVARDLAREFTPKRVNVVGAGSAEATEATLAYLESAPGVTGHYLAADD